MSLKAVFFDLDGTLLDTAPDFVLSLNQLADEYGIEQVSPDRIRQTVSNGARALTRLLFGFGKMHPGFEARLHRLLAIYSTHMGSRCELFEGMPSLLAKIAEHNLHWGIVTNKPLCFSEPIVGALDILKAPDVLICPEHVKKAKPDPEGILLSCAKVNCKPEDAVYIGDHQRDIECGRRAGCETIAVRFGYIAQQADINLWQADYIVDHSDEIWPILRMKL